MLYQLFNSMPLVSCLLSSIQYFFLVNRKTNMPFDKKKNNDNLSTWIFLVCLVKIYCKRNVSTLYIIGFQVRGLSGLRNV